MSSRRLGPGDAPGPVGRGMGPAAPRLQPRQMPWSKLSTQRIPGHPQQPRRGWYGGLAGASAVSALTPTARSVLLPILGAGPSALDLYRGSAPVPPPARATDSPSGPASPARAGTWSQPRQMPGLGLQPPLRGCAPSVPTRAVDGEAGKQPGGRWHFQTRHLPGLVRGRVHWPHSCRRSESLVTVARAGGGTGAEPLYTPGPQARLPDHLAPLS